MDLGQSYSVKKIVIYNRLDNMDRLSNSIVTLGGASGITVYSYEIGDTSQLDEVSFVVSKDKTLAKSAMSICDQTMSLLVGWTTSIGTLQAIADAVNEKGPQHMPGECCMDVATNSDFFGYRVSDLGYECMTLVILIILLCHIIQPVFNVYCSMTPSS